MSVRKQAGIIQQMLNSDLGKPMIEHPDIHGWKTAVAVCLPYAFYRVNGKYFLPLRKIELERGV